MSSTYFKNISFSTSYKASAKANIYKIGVEPLPMLQKTNADVRMNYVLRSAFL